MKHTQTRAHTRTFAPSPQPPSARHIAALASRVVCRGEPRITRKNPLSQRYATSSIVTSTLTDHHEQQERGLSTHARCWSSSSEQPSARNADANTASGPAAKRVLYEGHSPTSPWQRVSLAGWSAFSALRDPERADMVATLGEVTGRMALERLYR